MKSKTSTFYWAAEGRDTTRMVQRGSLDMCKTARHTQDCTPRSAYLCQTTNNGSGTNEVLLITKKFYCIIKLIIYHTKIRAIQYYTGSLGAQDLGVLFKALNRTEFICHPFSAVAGLVFLSVKKVPTSGRTSTFVGGHIVLTFSFPRRFIKNH